MSAYVILNNKTTDARNSTVSDRRRPQHALPTP
jgi:hypothetical protein